ncbi:MAG: DNA ligase D [Acidobacteria bacterium]|nr:DNA ligase D [Acidobacteriota bacterium]
MPLKDYARKRDFSSTPEPAAKAGKRRTQRLMFVVQKHKARRLHYDLRLEMEGVLKSWAVPKGPSYNPRDRRLAVQVEDHPLNYGDFEGTIPEGNYGAGTVIVWDKGTYELADGYDTDPLAGWRKGKLHIRLHGKKLQGIWILVRTASSTGKDWLLFKKNDDEANAGGPVTEERPESVASGRSIEEVEQSANSRQWITPVEETLERLGVKDGGKAPMPQHVRMMLATAVQESFDSADWIYEIKHDGLRAMAYKQGNRVRLLSRNDLEMTARFPEVRQAVAQLPLDQAILDGEIVAFDGEGRSSFQLLQPRMHVSRPADVALRMQEVPAYFILFDLLYCNGYLLAPLPLWKRREILQSILSSRGLSGEGSDHLLFSEHVDRHGKAFYQAATARRLEGIIAKQRNSRYESKRSPLWRKIRCRLRQEFVVVGYTEPKGSRGCFGSLLLGLYQNGKLLFTGSSGGGFDEETLQAIYRSLKKLETPEPPVAHPPSLKGAHWVRPQLVVEVQFIEWTQDGLIRQPVFAGIRPDKDPKACRREMLEKMAPATAGGNSPAGGPERPQAPRRRHERPSAAQESNPEGLAARRTSRKRSKSAPSSAPFETEHPIRFSNLNKMLWPKDGYTKRDLIAFYDRIAPFLLPHLKDRPLNLERFPDGIEGKSFYQKNTSDYFPDWIARTRIYSRESRRWVRYTLCDSRDALLYLANLACIPHNPWSSRAGSLDHPDYILFDLDPEEAPFSQVRDVALQLRRILETIGLDSCPKTSGATGIHVFVPLAPEYSYDDTRRLAHVVGILLVERLPDLVTLERVIKKRTGRVYIDFLQNGKGKTVVAPYVPRPRAGAPVSTPLTWTEMEKAEFAPGDFNIETIFRRLDKTGDLFAPVLSNKQSLVDPLRRLEKLVE